MLTDARLFRGGWRPALTIAIQFARGSNSENSMRYIDERTQVMQSNANIQSYQLSFPEGSPDSFENFRAIVRPMFDMRQVDVSEPFYGKASVHILSDMVLSSAACSGAIYERTGATILSSGADDILVLIYQGVPFSYAIGDQWTEVEPGDIAFFDLTRPLLLRAERVDNISLIVARRRLEPLISTIGDVHGFVLRDGVAKQLLSAHLELLLRVGQEIPASESQSISKSTVSLVDACLTRVANRTVENVRVGAASLVDLKEAVERQLNQHDFGPETLIRQFGVSRATLYRMFAPLGGVAAYITERRLRYALRVISDPSAPKPRIKQLAYDLGYKQPTAFSRAFRKFFGVTPSEVRTYKSYPTSADGTPWKIPQGIDSSIDSTARDRDAETRPI